jgi:hypothetical protein
MMASPVGPQTGFSLFWIALVAGILILVARLPESIFRPEFWAEDGLFFSEALAGGVRTLIEPYEGYLVVAHKTVLLAATVLPPPLAPLLSNGTQLLAIAGAAAFSATAGLPWSRSTGLLIALGIVLLPASLEVVGSISHFMWPAVFWAALVALKPEPRPGLFRNIETAGLAIVGLSGLASLLVWPLFLRGPRRRLLIVAATGIIQIAYVLTSVRSARAPVDYIELPFVVLLRLFVTPVLGPTVAEDLPAALTVLMGLALAVGITVLLLYLPRRLRAWCVIVLVATPAAGLLLSGYETTFFGIPENAPRYFWVAGAALVVTLAVNRHRAVAIPIIAALVIGSAMHFRLPAAEDMDWAEDSPCIGGLVACNVLVAPDERFTVHWQP